MSHPSGYIMAISSKVSHQIYGSSRLGEYKGQRTLSHKHFELPNHLGNVLVSNEKMSEGDGSGIFSHFAPRILSTSDYYPFGLAMEGRTSSGEGYRFGFNGMEKDESIAFGHYDLGLRIYNPATARMFSVDPRTKEYPWQSPYVYHRNSPIYWLDYLGGGDPKKRVKKAKSFEGTKYSMKENLNQGVHLRTASSKAALEYLDCSELICRVLAEDGITSQVMVMGTEDLVGFFNNENKFHKSTTPKVGDFYIWRGEGFNHTGIITGISYDGTKFEITHAKGTKYGVRIEDNKTMGYFTGQPGFKGFFRPIEEYEGSREYQEIQRRGLLNSARRELKMWKKIVSDWDKFDDPRSEIYQLYVLAAQANINSLERSGVEDNSFFEEAGAAMKYYNEHGTLPEWPETTFDSGDWPGADPIEDETTN